MRKQKRSVRIKPTTAAVSRETGNNCFTYLLWSLKLIPKKKTLLTMIARLLIFKSIFIKTTKSASRHSQFLDWHQVNFRPWAVFFFNYCCWLRASPIVKISAFAQSIFDYDLTWFFSRKVCLHMSWEESYARFNIYLANCNHVGDDKTNPGPGIPWKYENSKKSENKRRVMVSTVRRLNCSSMKSDKGFAATPWDSIIECNESEMMKLKSYS